MRAAALVIGAALWSCQVYDPLAELTFTEYPDTRTAVAAILEEAATPRVFAVGEYHPSRAIGQGRSPLTRFTDEVIGLLEPFARYMVVETWHDDCGTSSINTQLSVAMGRPPSTAVDLEHLAMRSQRLRIAARGLEITCLEHQAMRDPQGGIDFFRLLELVTEKLVETTRQTLATSRQTGVIVYGGALHNDLFPRWPLDGLSYAAPLAKELGPGAVLEIDLVVPEVVAPMMLVRVEPWFPLLGRASPDRVLVWKRGPGSYVVILPALTDAVARIAQAPGA
ncbi:MAG: hypothetical protein H0T79_15380 [Deltaproteobacteria bacterium]|nr:hypothetical protein [Deltaproteobacteria bacterium]